MTEDRETQGETTESTERIRPGSMPPDDHSGSGPTDGDAAGDSSGGTGVEERGHEPAGDADTADQESKQSFPASDPPAW